jgi:hypothetical protein
MCGNLPVTPNSKLDRKAVAAMAVHEALPLDQLAALAPSNGGD